MATWRRLARLVGHISKINIILELCTKKDQISLRKYFIKFALKMVQANLLHSIIKNKNNHDLKGY